jgi:hypothetical protein
LRGLTQRVPTFKQPTSYLQAAVSAQLVLPSEQYAALAPVRVSNTHIMGGEQTQALTNAQQ